MKNFLILILIAAICYPLFISEKFTDLFISKNNKEISTIDFTTDNWVYTDQYNRSLADYSSSGPKREKLVGIFYYIWHSDRQETINNTDFFKSNPNGINELEPGAVYYWGEPEDGYYNTNDPWIIRKHLRMLAVAGIDFLYFDVTNGVNEKVFKAVENLATISLQMRKDGIKTPNITFTTYYRQDETIQALYENIYKPEKYKELWQIWEGKPVIMAPKSAAANPEISDFFTWRYGWNAWGEKLQNSWPWHNIGGYGYTSDSQRIEQMTVSKASHPTINVGSSYHLGPQGIVRFGADLQDQCGGIQPAINQYYRSKETGKGALFEQQWDRVFENDPDVLMITQWNEWIAVCCTQKYCIEVWKHPDMVNDHFLGKKIGYEDRYFVDQFNDEYNRDIEPMKGGYGDVFFYRMVNYIRRFKGMDPPVPPSRPKTIRIDGEFLEWMNVLPIYTDFKGDIDHRDYMGATPGLNYVNKTGRNDIIQARVARDSKSLYMYVSTASPLTPYTDPNWMLLYIDSDCNKQTGWEGYDFLINSEVIDEQTTTLKKWNGTEWEDAIKIPYRVSGGEMELSIPLGEMGLKPSDVRLNFHWADNIQRIDDITEFCINGDSAPDRKFNYHYGK